MHRALLHSATAFSPRLRNGRCAPLPINGCRFLNVRPIRAISNAATSLTGGKKREDTRYGEEDYWNERYQEEAFLSFDWYQNYIDLAPILKKHIPKSAKVLMAGCGNAVMSEDMVKDGYQQIINVDYSSVLIDALKFKYKRLPQLTYKVMDVRNMSEFEDNSFDAAIDKGLIDAMVCATNGAEDVSRMLSEMYRVIKPGGNFVLVTYGFPLTRVPALMDRGLKWLINCWTFPKPYSGRSLSKYPEPVLMEPISKWANTRKEDYETGTNFVYVATKR